MKISESLEIIDYQRFEKTSSNFTDVLILHLETLLYKGFQSLSRKIVPILYQKYKRIPSYPPVISYSRNVVYENSLIYGVPIDIKKGFYEYVFCSFAQ